MFTYKELSLTQSAIVWFSHPVLTTDVESSLMSVRASLSVGAALIPLSVGTL